MGVFYKAIPLTIPPRANNMKKIWYQRMKLFLPMEERVRNVGNKILHFTVGTMLVEGPGLLDSSHLYSQPSYTVSWI